MVKGKYKVLNDKSKLFFIKIINGLNLDNIIKKECYKEIDNLYESGVLFIIEYLYIYKEDNNTISYNIYGLNNSILFKILDIKNIKSSKSNFLNIEFINSSVEDFINTIHICNGGDFKLYRGSFELKSKDNIEELKNNYLIISSCDIPYNMTFKYDKNEAPEIDILSTIEDYRLFEDDYLIIKINNKYVLEA